MFSEVIEIHDIRPGSFLLKIGLKHRIDEHSQLPCMHLNTMRVPLN